jgi:hypothetical protein
MCACKIGGEWLLEKDCFSKLERAPGNIGLQMGGNRDRDNRDGGLLHQCLPPAERTRNIGGPRDFCRSLRIASS